MTPPTSPFDAVDGSSTRHLSAMDVGATGSHDFEELPMQTVATIGLDIAKSVFQVHGVAREGNVIIRRQLKALCIGILSEAVAVLNRYRSLCFVAPLVA
jgi:hypothetical protein